MCPGCHYVEQLVKGKSSSKCCVSLFILLVHYLFLFRFFFPFRLLITVSKLATLADVKQGVCEVIGGRLLPDSVVMVYVKSNAVECVLVSYS